MQAKFPIHSLIRSFNHSFIYSFIPFIHSFIHSFIHLYPTRTLIHYLVYLCFTSNLHVNSSRHKFKVIISVHHSNSCCKITRVSYQNIVYLYPSNVKLKLELQQEAVRARKHLKNCNIPPQYHMLRSLAYNPQTLLQL